MRRAALILALALSRVGAQPPMPEYATTIEARLADPVDRRMWGIGIVPEQFYFSFRTTYRIHGVQVEPAVFWRAPLVGHLFQVKAARRAGFWFATAINLKE